MYHIGGVDKLPTFPGPELLSPVGSDFMHKCLIKQAENRDTAEILLKVNLILDFLMEQHEFCIVHAINLEALEDWIKLPV